MLDFWHNYKVRYLRKHNTLDFDSMRELSVPSRIIKEVLLNEVIMPENTVVLIISTPNVIILFFFMLFLLYVVKKKCHNSVTTLHSHN
jgi:hypothetical protein